ncbi:MAG: type II toxin-antitoxin system RelE/ParE family toxin [Janthinobacterium sp.]|jgi:mRNA interferase RelE/StbE
MFKIGIAKDAERFLKSCPKKMKEDLKKQINALAYSPRDRGKALRGKEFKDLYRIKLSYKGVAYRAVYEIDDTIVYVLILFIDKREQVYERLKRKLKSIAGI